MVPAALSLFDDAVAVGVCNNFGQERVRMKDISRFSLSSHLLSSRIIDTNMPFVNWCLKIVNIRLVRGGLPGRVPRGINHLFREVASLAQVRLACAAGAIQWVTFLFWCQFYRCQEYKLCSISFRVLERLSCWRLSTWCEILLQVM